MPATTAERARAMQKARADWHLIKMGPCPIERKFLQNKFRRYECLGMCMCESPNGLHTDRQTDGRQETHAFAAAFWAHCSYAALARRRFSSLCKFTNQIKLDCPTIWSMLPTLICLPVSPAAARRNCLWPCSIKTFRCALATTIAIEIECSFPIAEQPQLN